MPPIEHINKVDTNRDWSITKTEIDDFFSKSKESDVKQLATELTTSLEKNQIFLDVSIDQAHQNIAAKINQGKDLTPNDIKLLKLWLCIRQKQSIQNFDGTWTPDLQVKFPFYKANISTIQNNISKLKNKENTLPNIQFNENFSNVAVQKLSDRAKTNFYSEYENVRIKAEMKYQDKPHAQSYIQYSCAKFAFEKYQETISKQSEKQRTAAGYPTEKDFDAESTKMQQFQIRMEQELKNAFPTIETTQNNWQKYQGEIQTAAKRTGYDKPGIYESHNKIYNAYLKKINALQSTEIDPQELQKALSIVQSPKMENAQQVEEYMKSLNYVKYYGQRVQEIRATSAPKLLEGFENYNKEIAKINQKFGPENITKRSQELNKYYQKTQEITKTAGAGINFQRYQKYMSLLQKNGVLKSFDTLKGLQKIIANPGGENSPFLGIVLDAQQQKKDQQDTDLFYAKMNLLSPGLYTVANFATGLWNGLVDALVGTGSSLGLMLMSLYKNEEELQDAREHKQSFDSFLKVGTSTSMQEPPIKDGKRNLGFDNTVNQVGSQISNMLVLLAGGSTVAKGFARLGEGVTLGSKILIQSAPKLGLFTNAMIMQSGRSFEEGLAQGLSKQEAFGYGMLQSVVSSSLELISPNNLIMGEWKVMLTKLAGKEGQKKILAQFLKHEFKEMGQEIAQEEMQLLAQKGVDRMLAKTADFNLDPSMTWADFSTTALLTGLTTGISSGMQSYHQAKMDVSNTDARQQRKQVLNHIVADESRYQHYLSKLDGIISTSSGESASQFQTLKVELQTVHAQQSNPEQFKKLVLENAQLSDESRIAKVEELLGIKLSPEQIQAILQAHKIGQGGVFEYTLTDIRQKSDLLESIGITGNQKRILMEYGLVGQYPENIQVQSEQITTQENTNETNNGRSFERNTIRMEMHEIQRKSDVIAIGDLSGDAETFKGVLNKHNLVDVEGKKWIGGDTKIVLHGDILADKKGSSFEVFEMVNKLNEQAQKEGGEIVLIMGNHDRLLTDLLTTEDIDDVFENMSGKYVLKHSGKNMGLNELSQFLDNPEEKITKDWKTIRTDGTIPESERKQKLIEKRNQIIESMKKSDQGKLVLEQICKSKIIEQIDDCLYIHVAPHDGLLDFIENNAPKKSDGSKDIPTMIDTTNALWQKYLKNKIYKEGPNLTQEEQQQIQKIKDVFLSEGTDTYTTSTDAAKYDKLKNSGINIIQHGHIGKEKTTLEFSVQIKSNDAEKADDKDHKINKGMYTGFTPESSVKKDQNLSSQETKNE